MTESSKRTLTVHGCSVSITLPKPWLRERGLEPHDLVEVTATDSALIIRPLKPREAGR
jgi:bifunctional DNA-binding transcriptional regulator/antitoxin component of YhaV-PrlF toxin-antitoxin module